MRAGASHSRCSLLSDAAASDAASSDTAASAADAFAAALTPDHAARSDKLSDMPLPTL